MAAKPSRGRQRFVRIERIDETAGPATDRAAQPRISSLFRPARGRNSQRNRRRRRDRFPTAEWWRRNDRRGRWIRHARPAPAECPPGPVLLLPVPMVESAFGALLIAAVGRLVLSAPGFGTAPRTAVALAAIAMGTNPEHHLASLAAANALPENHFSLNRHPPRQADFDNGNGSCQGRTSFDGGLLMNVGCRRSGRCPAIRESRTQSILASGSYAPKR